MSAFPVIACDYMLFRRLQAHSSRKCIYEKVVSKCLNTRIVILNSKTGNPSIYSLYYSALSINCHFKNTKLYFNKT